MNSFPIDFNEGVNATVLLDLAWSGISAPAATALTPGCPYWSLGASAEALELSRSRGFAQEPLPCRLDQEDWEDEWYPQSVEVHLPFPYGCHLEEERCLPNLP